MVSNEADGDGLEMDYIRSRDALVAAPLLESFGTLVCSSKKLNCVCNEFWEGYSYGDCIAPVVLRS